MTALGADLYHQQSFECFFVVGELLRGGEVFAFRSVAVDDKLFDDSARFARHYKYAVGKSYRLFEMKTVDSSSSREMFRYHAYMSCLVISSSAENGSSNNIRLCPKKYVRMKAAR